MSFSPMIDALSTKIEISRCLEAMRNDVDWNFPAQASGSRRRIHPDCEKSHRARLFPPQTSCILEIVGDCPRFSGGSSSSSN